MNIALIVDISSSRTDGSVVVTEVNRKGDNLSPIEINSEITTQMTALCEGLVTLIHVADQNDIRNSAASLRDCITHLESGFLDPKYVGVIQEGFPE